MLFLVPTLARVLEQADALFDARRLPQARRAYEHLVQRAQEHSDRATEVCARAMLARCQLAVRDVEGARAQLLDAGRWADPEHVDAFARYRGVLARLSIEDGPREVTHTELRAYLQWAEDARRGVEILDACMLLAEQTSPADRVDWLRRGIEQSELLGSDPGLGRAWTHLAAALDELGQTPQALEAYQQALRWHRDHDAGRPLVSTAWAVGALACRIEEWPLGRTVLEQALDLAANREDCDDLVPLILADLARVYEAAGDVIEARRLMIRALSTGREQHLDAVWPERWQALFTDAQRLEVG